MRHVLCGNMKYLIALKIFLILFTIQILGQNIDSSFYFDEEYFISENAIDSDTIKFTENQLVKVYKDFRLDTLLTIVNVLKNSKYSVTSTLVNFIPGQGIMKVDTIMRCDSYNDNSSRKINLSKGDTIIYYMYMGEGEELIGIDSCYIKASMSMYGKRIFDLIKTSSKLGERKYLEELNGWINPDNYKIEKLRVWIKTY